MTATNILRRLHSEQGQSPWIDNLRRGYLTSGQLQGLVDRGVRGLTSNPTIFQKAIQGSSEYDAQFEALARQGLGVEQIYWELVLDDIAGALSAFRPLYDASNGTDGFVSVEVDPGLATDGEATLTAARALHERIDAPNVMIKIPATREGLPAIRTMIAEGRNVNVTLIFSLERYADVIEAYVAGLEDRLAEGHNDLSTVNSVASFFISRVDSEVDDRLARGEDEAARELSGRAAIAQGHLAYGLFLERFSGDRWHRLKSRGAKVQRPLWASTSTKNPAYPDTLYVDTLIGPDTVNTLPDQTLEAFDDHGTVARTVDTSLTEARATWNRLAEVGIDMADVAAKLEADGVASFQKSFVELLDALRVKLGSGSAAV